MAEIKDIAFKVTIDGVDRQINSLKDLKQAKKDATDAFIKGDKEAAKTLAELKDKTEDLTDATRSLKQDGVEGLTGSFGLLREGLGSGDFEKAKVGLKGIGSAMSAIPILLLVEGFKFLIDNFQEVIKFGKELFNLFSDEERAVRKLNAELENQKRVTAGLTKELSREIELMEAQGVSHDKILAKKKELIEAQIKEAEISVKTNFAKIKEAQANDTIVESLQRKQAAIYRSVGADKAADAIEQVIAQSKKERTQKEVDDFNNSIELLKDLRNKELVEVAKVETEKRKQIKQTKDEQFGDLQSKGISPLSQSKLDEAELLNQGLQGINEKYAQLDRERLAKSEEYFKQIEENKGRATLDITQRSLQAGQALSDAFFAIKMSKVQKGSAEELALAKKQFEINKAFQIGLTITQGIQNGITAYGAGLKAAAATGVGAAVAPAIGAAYAAISAIGTIAAVAKIASTQFNSTAVGNINTGGGGNVSLPQGNTNTAPNVTQPLNAPPTTTFTGNNNNNFQPLKAVVVETENRKTTNRIDKLTNESTY